MKYKDNCFVTAFWAKILALKIWNEIEKNSSMIQQQSGFMPGPINIVYMRKSKKGLNGKIDDINICKHLEQYV